MLSSHSANRAWQKQLDECLTVLEDAHERDEQIVSAAVSASVRRFVPGIVTGMPTAQALDLVFRAQHECLHAVTPCTNRGDDPAIDEVDIESLMESGAGGRGERATTAEPLDARAARALTERIKGAANNFSLLLLEAQERQAWLPLGYRTWQRYVRQEFGLSRTRSYELLDHGRLIRAIQATTGVSLIADIPPYAARKVKPYFGQFIAGLKSRLEGRPAEEIPLIVSDVIRNTKPRVRVLMRREPAAQLSDHVLDAIVVASPGRRGLAVDVDVLLAVVRYLASLPPVTGVLGDLAPSADTLLVVERGTAWLAELGSELRAQQSRAIEADGHLRPRVVTG